tara:strand:+ start:766 stop:1020 length:255 start_codon:yes stop_codon:yes gene_type:complete
MTTKTKPNLKIIYTNKITSIVERGKTQHENFFFEVFFDNFKWGLYFNNINTMPFKVGEVVTYELISYDNNYIIKFYNPKQTLNK